MLFASATALDNCLILIIALSVMLGWYSYLEWQEKTKNKK